MDQNEKPNKETLEQWHRDPANWRFGIFYFNPADKRIFPPKKLRAFGWTVNFANPLSVLAILGIILLVVAIQTFVFKD